MLGTKAPATARKKNATAKDATTEPNWSTDREPMRIFVPGLRRRDPLRSLLGLPVDGAVQSAAMLRRTE